MSFLFSVYVSGLHTAIQREDCEALLSASDTDWCHLAIYHQDDTNINNLIQTSVILQHIEHQIEHTEIYSIIKTILFIIQS